jgi:hypothetical protein
MATTLIKSKAPSCSISIGLRHAPYLQTQALSWHTNFYILLRPIERQLAVPTENSIERSTRAITPLPVQGKNVQPTTRNDCRQLSTSSIRLRTKSRVIQV